jgi:hypothetical protein
MSVLTPLTIEIKLDGSQGYKSIRELVWDGVPPFAILTGVNGSGKTQGGPRLHAHAGVGVEGRVGQMYPRLAPRPWSVRRN